MIYFSDVFSWYWLLIGFASLFALVFLAASSIYSHAKKIGRREGAAEGEKRGYADGYDRGVVFTAAGSIYSNAKTIGRREDAAAGAIEAQQKGYNEGRADGFAQAMREQQNTGKRRLMQLGGDVFDEDDLLSIGFGETLAYREPGKPDQFWRPYASVTITDPAAEPTQLGPVSFPPSDQIAAQQIGGAGALKPIPAAEPATPTVSIEDLPPSFTVDSHGLTTEFGPPYYESKHSPTATPADDKAA